MRSFGAVLCLGGLLGACQAQSRNFGDVPDAGNCIGARCVADTDEGSGGDRSSDPEPGATEPSGADETEGAGGPVGNTEDPDVTDDDVPRTLPEETDGIGFGTDDTEGEPNGPGFTDPGPGEPGPGSSDPSNPGTPEPEPSDPGPGNPQPSPEPNDPTPSGPGNPEPTDPDPGPGPSNDPLEDEPIGGCGNQLLRNSGFDQGDVDWITHSTWPGAEVIVRWDDAALQRENVAPYAGTHLAWLGGIPSNQYDGHIVAMEQRVVIPETASTLTFSGRVWIRTEEDELGVAYDKLYADLFDDVHDDAKVTWLAGAWSNLDASTGWVAFSRETTTEYLVLGREVSFQLHSRTDPELVTSFWFDSLRLVAHCGR